MHKIRRLWGLYEQSSSDWLEQMEEEMVGKESKGLRRLKAYTMKFLNINKIKEQHELISTISIEELLLGITENF